MNVGEVKEFIKKIAYKFEPEIDKQISIIRKPDVENVDPNRSLFTAETTRKVMENIFTKDREV